MASNTGLKTQVCWACDRGQFQGESQDESQAAEATGSKIGASVEERINFVAGNGSCG